MDPREVKSLFKATSYMEQARQIIKRLILNGTYRPGDRLKEAEIARDLGISRSPVREAVMNLASEGLIKLHPQRGAFVRDFGLREVQELFEVREAVEVQAVRLAAERAGKQDFAKLRKFLDATERALEKNEANPDGLRGRPPANPYPVDLDFHTEVSRLAKNERLAQYVVEINTQLQLARVKSTISRPGRAREAYEEHVAIYEAIKSGDPDQAERAMKASLRNVLRNLGESLGESAIGVA